MRVWTLAERKRQSQLIKQWQPWRFGGVKTASGKAISKMNALKTGIYIFEVRTARKLLTRIKKLTSR